MKKIYALQVIFILLLGFASMTGYAQEAPYLAPIDDQTAVTNHPFTFDVNALNADPAETYELTVSRPGMTINPVTGLISWTPADIADGGMVTVRAYNTAGEAVRSFNIYLSNAIECPPSLISYWKLDSLTGDTVFTDFAGGYDATPLTPLQDTIGVVDSAQIFVNGNKTTQFLRVPHTNSHTWARADSFSISMWFLYKGDNLNNNQVLLAKGAIGKGNSLLLLSTLNTGPEDRLVFELETYSDSTSALINTVESSVDLQVNQWYHVVASYEGATFPDSAKMKISLNGIKDEVRVKPGNSGFITARNLCIGYWDAFGANRYPFNGVLDEIAIFDKSLSATEITNMHDAAMNGLPICRPGNYAPLFTSTPGTVATQDQAYSYTVGANDFENDPLILTADILPSWLHFDGTSLTGTPANANVGDTIVDILVTDGDVEIHQNFNLHVANVNDAPVITSVPADTIISQGETFTYVVQFMDPDVDDNAVLTVPILPSWITFDPVTSTLQGTATNDQVQFEDEVTFTVKLQVKDGSGITVVQQFSVKVLNVNDPPVVVSQQDLSTDRNTSLEVGIGDLTIEDPDNLLSEIGLILLPGSHYSVDGTRVIPEENYYGDLSVNMKVTDYTDTVDYNLAVTVNFVNLPPKFTSVPETVALKGKAYSYLVMASDADINDPQQNQDLTYWGENLPSWLEFNSGNHVLVGVPTIENVGNSDVKLGISDGIDTVYQEFTIMVGSENSPVITGQEILKGTKNGNIVITIDDLTITDPDNVPADMTLTILPGNNYNVNGNTVTFAQGFLGDLSVGVQVNDGENNSNIFQLIITVEPGLGVPLISRNFVGRVYPNPSSDYVIFELTGNNPGHLEIRDLSGKVKILRKLEQGTGDYRLDISGLAPGIYIYKVYNDKEYQVGKLLVE